MDTNKRHTLARSEAAEWCARLPDAALTRAEREQFVDWLRESPLHVAEMLRMASVEGALRRFDRWPPEGEGGAEAPEVVVSWPAASMRTEPPQPLDIGAERPKRRYRLAVAGACALALLALAVGSLWGLRGQVIQTGRAERQQLALVDGSVVLMDPETRLRLRFDQRERHVTLERGRALFHVAKNPTRPFVVETRAILVRAVGTAFAVERQSDGVLVTVAEGRVAVITPGEDPSSPGPGTDGRPELPGAVAGPRSGAVPRGGAVPDTSPAPQTTAGAVEEFTLGANEQITVGAGAHRGQVRPVNSERALSWASGRLVFDHQPVSAVVAEFNRYNRIQLRVQDPNLAQRPVSGVFEALDPESFIAFMQTVADVRIDRTGEREIAMGSNR